LSTPSGEQIVIEGRLGGRAVGATWFNGHAHGAAIAQMRALDEIDSVRIGAPAEVPSLSFGGN
jgi:hypothetical protein